MRTGSDPALAEALRTREMQVERTINGLRAASLAGLVLLDVMALRGTDQMHRGDLPLFAGALILLVVYSGLVHRLADPEHYRPWLKYVTIGVDMGMVLAVFAEYRALGITFGLSDETFRAHFAMSVIPLVFMSALRHSIPAIGYAAVLAAADALYVTLSGGGHPVIAAYCGVMVAISAALAIAVSQGISSLFLRLRHREQLTRFLSRELVESVDAGAVALELGGRTQTVTVLISDIRGFTHLSEGLDPQAVVALLNEYFTRMTAVVFQHGGTVDKFLGDGLLAVFGAPVAHPDDARRALDAAADMADALAELNAGWEAQGRAPIAIGIGLHTGPAVAGILGSPERMEYTVIGDTVNLASRVEGLNKEFHTWLLLTEETREAAGADLPCRFVGETRVRGRETPVRLYTLQEG